MSEDGIERQLKYCNILLFLNLDNELLKHQIFYQCMYSFH